MATRRVIENYPDGEELDLKLYKQSLEFILWQQLEPQPWYLTMEWQETEGEFLPYGTALTASNLLADIVREALSADIQITKSVFSPWQSVSPEEQVIHTFSIPLTGIFGTRELDADGVDTEYDRVLRFTKAALSGRQGRMDLRGAVTVEDIVQTSDGIVSLNPASTAVTLAEAVAGRMNDDVIGSGLSAFPAMIGRVILNKDYPSVGADVQQPVIHNMSAPIVRSVQAFGFKGMYKKQLRHS